jgi:hypothetical protein
MEDIRRAAHLRQPMGSVGTRGCRGSQLHTARHSQRTTTITAVCMNLMKPPTCCLQIRLQPRARMSRSIQFTSTGGGAMRSHDSEPPTLSRCFPALLIASIRHSPELRRLSELNLLSH